MSGPLAALLRGDGAREATRFRRAAGCAGVLGVAAVALLGVSGWFIAASAAAGLAGIAAATSFNYLLPSAAIRLLAIARTAARYGERLLGHEAALRTLARIRPAIFAAVARAAPARALGLSSGEAATALVQDVQAIELRLAQRTAAGGAAAAAIAGTGLAALASGAAAASTLACLAALLAAAHVLAARAARSAVAVRRAVGGLKEELSLLAASQMELRCYALEGWAADAATRASDALEAAQRRHARVLGAFDAVQALAMGIAATAGLWFARSAGAPLAALAGLAAAMTIEGAGPLLRAMAHRGVARAAATRLDDLLAAPVSAASTEGAANARAATIELSAPFAARLVAGDRVAIVGPSGCGKSTLVETLVGLRERVHGVARLDGHDLASLPADRLRACFAWLPQDASLIAGSVRDNLRLAGDHVDEASMWDALRDVRLADRVRGWPGGLDTWLGEDGARLSGGERRRLALARAFLRDAPWLLLDEPTVGLDDATEAAVLHALLARLDRTGQGLVVVTHRRPVVALCGRVLEAGASAEPPTGLASDEGASEAASRRDVPSGERDGPVTRHSPSVTQ